MPKNRLRHRRGNRRWSLLLGGPPVLGGGRRRAVGPAVRFLLSVRDSSIAWGGSPRSKVEGSFSVTLTTGPRSPLHQCIVPALVSVHDPAPCLSLPSGSRGYFRFSRLSVPAFCSGLVRSSGFVAGAVTTPQFLRWIRCIGAVGGSHPGFHPLGSIQAGSVGHLV